MSTVTERSALEIMSECGYRFINRLWEAERIRDRLYFTDNGKARLAHIAGWLTGLAHVGKTTEAEQFADQLTRQLEWLARCGETVDVMFRDAVLKVPARKVMLADDGCFHGFGFCAYYPDAPVASGAAMPQQSKWEEAMVEYKYTAYGSVRVPYRFVFNGGLLYYGPGHGENNSVAFGESDSAWRIHT